MDCSLLQIVILLRENSTSSKCLCPAVVCLQRGFGFDSQSCLKQIFKLESNDVASSILQPVEKITIRVCLGMEPNEKKLQCTVIPRKLAKFSNSRYLY